MSSGLQLPTQQEMLGALIAAPSVSSPVAELDQSNCGVVDLVAEWAAGLGFRVDIRPLPMKPGTGLAGRRPKVNLVATLGEGDDGLVLSGHSDTVPCDADAWQSDPFRLTARDGKLVGLGTADMKGFFAAALHAVAQFDARRLRRPITLLATADEESTMAGARALAEQGESLGRVAVIGEPTGLVPVRKHKGVSMVRITITGRAGHASDPARGVNAIDGMQHVLAALDRWRTEVASRLSDDDFEVPAPTLNFGRVHGGDSPNRICGRCDLDVDLRLLPTMKHEAVVQELRSVVGTALAGGDWQAAVQPTGVHVDAYATPPDSAFCKEVEILCGCSAQAVMFGTEAPFLAQLGLETLVLGAGDIRVAHQPDEYVTIEAIRRATDLYAGLIRRICIEAA